MENDENLMHMTPDQAIEYQRRMNENWSQAALLAAIGRLQDAADTLLVRQRGLGDWLLAEGIATQAQFDAWMESSHRGYRMYCEALGLDSDA